MNKAVFMAERVAQAIIPDLDGRPAYVLEPSMVDGAVLTRGHGMYAANLDYACQEQLEQAGRWRGPGVGVIVDSQQAVAQFGDSAESWIVGAALHEFCHWLDVPEADTPSQPAAQVASEIKEVVNELEPTKRRASSQALHDQRRLLNTVGSHRGPFTRLAVHAWYRACHSPSGFILSPRHLAIGNTYGGCESLPAPQEFIDMLRNELESTSTDMPLRELITSPAPPAYTELWRGIMSDVWQRLEAAA